MEREYLSSLGPEKDLAWLSLAKIGPRLGHIPMCGTERYGVSTTRTMRRENEGSFTKETWGTGCGAAKNKPLKTTREVIQSFLLLSTYYVADTKLSNFYSFKKTVPEHQLHAKHENKKDMVLVLKVWREFASIISYNPLNRHIRYVFHLT